MPAQPGEAFTVLESATRTSTTTTNLVNADGASGVTIIVDASDSAGNGTEDLQVILSAVDPTSGNTIEWISDVAFADGANGTVAYLISPVGADSQSAYKALQDVPLPREWQIKAELVGGGTGTVSYTYSISANYHH